MAGAAVAGTNAVIAVAALWVSAVTVNARTATKKARQERSTNHD
jgi:hypothetical protein